MAMVFCKGCGKEIHDSAATCPHCGAPQGSVQAQGAIPAGVTGWSWGAFLLNWIWAIGNKTWIGLLALVPFVGFVMAIVLGVKGREWAWQNGKWESVEHFNRVQKKWSIWGIGLTLAGFVLMFVMGILAAIAIPSYQDYGTKAKLSKVNTALDPLKIAVAMSYQETGKLPRIHTVVTHENQGQPATPDWAELGFTTLPMLPAEIETLGFAGEQIVVELDNLTFRGSRIGIMPVVNAQGLSWEYACESGVAVVKSYFKC